MFTRYTGLHPLIQNLSVILANKIGVHKKVASSVHNTNNHKSAFPGNNLILQHEEKLYKPFSLHYIKYLEDVCVYINIYIILYIHYFLCIYNIYFKMYIYVYINFNNLVVTLSFCKTLPSG